MSKKTQVKKASDDQDAWERFEHAVDIALHTPAKHKTVTKKKPAKNDAVKKPATEK